MAAIKLTGRESAHLDEMHAGDIRGGLGTIRQNDTAKRRTSWRIFITFLAILGPGLIVKVGDNDAGAFGTYTQAAQNYGTTEYGGTGHFGCGTVFKLSPSGSGYTHHMLHNFSGGDGCLPLGKVFLERNGAIFGTASIGGEGCSGIGCGLVYELSPASGGYRHRTVYEFDGSSHHAFDGAEPDGGGFIVDASGNLYGTARSGGSKTKCSNGGARGCGTVF